MAVADGGRGNSLTQDDGNTTMKLLYGLIGAALVIAFLGSVVWKVREVSLVVVILIGVALMLVDLWHARNEADT